MVSHLLALTRGRTCYGEDCPIIDTQRLAELSHGTTVEHNATAGCAALGLFLTRQLKKNGEKNPRFQENHAETLARPWNEALQTVSPSLGSKAFRNAESRNPAFQVILLPRFLVRNGPGIVLSTVTRSLENSEVAFETKKTNKSPKRHQNHQFKAPGDKTINHTPPSSVASPVDPEENSHGPPAPKAWTVSTLYP